MKEARKLGKTQLALTVALSVFCTGATYKRNVTYAGQKKGPVCLIGKTQITHRQSDGKEKTIPTPVKKGEKVITMKCLDEGMVIFTDKNLHAIDSREGEPYSEGGITVRPEYSIAHYNMREHMKAGIRKWLLTDRVGFFLRDDDEMVMLPYFEKEGVVIPLGKDTSFSSLYEYRGIVFVAPAGKNIFGCSFSNGSGKCSRHPIFYFAPQHNFFEAEGELFFGDPDQWRYRISVNGASQGVKVEFDDRVNKRTEP